MNRIQEIERKLAHHLHDNTMSDPLWNQVRAQLLLELNKAHKAHAFDYDALISDVRADEIAERTEDAPEYDRQWAQSLHPWTVKVIGLFVMSQSALWVIGIAAIAA